MILPKAKIEEIKQDVENCRYKNEKDYMVLDLCDTCFSILERLNGYRKDRIKEETTPIKKNIENYILSKTNKTGDSGVFVINHNMSDEIVRDFYIITDRLFEETEERENQKETITSKETEGPKDTQGKTDSNYKELKRVFDMAYDQAAIGKGKERHAEGEPFEKQIICEVARRVGLGYTLGQAVKKIYESKRLPKDAAIAELIGAINYIAANILVLEERSE